MLWVCSSLVLMEDSWLEEGGQEEPMRALSDSRFRFSPVQVVLSLSVFVLLTLSLTIPLPGFAFVPQNVENMATCTQPSLHSGHDAFVSLWLVL